MKLLWRIGVSLAAVLLVTYLADWIVASSKAPGQVSIQPLLAVPQKNGRFEFILDTPYQGSCVHSLLPHNGMAPCWYLEGHKRPIRPM